MECFEELKDSIGELLINSQKSCCESNQCESSNLSGGAVAGIVIGILVGVGIIIAVLGFIYLKKSNKFSSKKFPSINQPSTFIFWKKSKDNTQPNEHEME